ncbi:pectinesterase family protein [Hyphomonas sp.]|uniref:pectinesterase family protein n=1 Tax=Hyphomonas sp. TaxID=87 RepID=UPI00391D8ACE
MKPISMRTLISAAALALSGCASAPAATSVKPGYIVSKACNDRTGCFTRFQDAIDQSANQSPETWIRILVEPGDYYEKVRIDRARLELIGSGADQTRLHFDAVASTAGAYHRDNWGTPGSATLTINADEVTVKDLTVENTYDYLSNDRLDDQHPDKNGNPQAAAALLDVASDRVLMKGVKLIGYQDTLFLNGGRLYFVEGFVSGNVDFIFGNGTGLFEDSIIESRLRGSPYPAGEVQSFIAAPSTQLDRPLGLAFHRCRLTREAGLPDRSVTLGRPWHPTTKFPDGRYADPDAVGYAQYIDTWMDAHIHEDRWSPMNGTARDGSKSAVFFPEDSRFFELGSSGPGALPNTRDMKWQSTLGIDDIRSIVFEGWEAGREDAR